MNKATAIATSTSQKAAYVLRKIKPSRVIEFCRQQEADLRVEYAQGQLDVAELSDIVDIALDSRLVAQGFVFVAFQGAHQDGRDYCAQAISNGAALILTDDRPIDQSYPVPVLHSRNPEKLCALLSAYLYENQPEMQVLVTGTSGKTSVADYARQLWQFVGFSAASVGTLGVRGAKTVHQAAGLTSPDSVTMAAIMRALSSEGINHTCIEASSHGIMQHRLDGLSPKIGVFTGLGRDHLDYHGDLDSYLQAKMRLFQTLLPADATVVYAADHDGSDRLQSIIKQRGMTGISYGIEVGDIQAKNLQRDPAGLHFDVCHDGYQCRVTLPLIGDFQCLNVLAAYGALWASGVGLSYLQPSLSQLSPVAGRMQKIGITEKGATVYVDYAHSPDALQAVLGDIRKHLQGALWLGFGCGGDRDKGKRPAMGLIAKGADYAVVCDDNPRSEDPALIRAEILAKIPQATEIGDRGQAIAYLCQNAGLGDVVLIAGKGHEQGQIVAGQIFPFDDAAEAAKYCISVERDN